MGRNKNAPYRPRDAMRERRALNRERSTYDVSETQFHEPGVTARPISRWCALNQFEVLFSHKSYEVMLQNDARRARLPAIDYETVENDVRSLLLTNARHGFHNRARYWRSNGDASNCFHNR